MYCFNVVTLLLINYSDKTPIQSIHIIPIVGIYIYKTNERNIQTSDKWYNYHSPL